MFETCVRVQVYLGEFRDQQVQAVRLVELGDVLLKAEVVDDFAGAASRSP